MLLLSRRLLYWGFTCLIRYSNKTYKLGETLIWYVCNYNSVRYIFVSRISMKLYSLMALITVGTMGFSNASMGYLNFPTQVMLNSADSSIFQRFFCFAHCTDEDQKFETMVCSWNNENSDNMTWKILKVVSYDLWKFQVNFSSF